MRKNIFIGLCLIIAATLLFLSSIGYLEGIEITSIIVGVILLIIFISSLFHLEFFGVFISLAIALLFYEDTFRLYHFEPLPLMSAAVLMGIGCNIIFSKAKRKVNNNQYKKCVKFKYNEFEQNNSQSSSQSTSESVVTFYSNLSDTSKFIKSDSLENGYFKNNLGSLSIYLDDVELSEKGAKIELICNFGDIKIFIPKKFNIINNLDCMIGEIKEQHYNSDNTNKDNTIQLTGNVFCGQIEIIRV